MSSDKRDSDFPLTKNTSGSSTPVTPNATSGSSKARPKPKSNFWKTVRLVTTGILCVGAATAGTLLGNLYLHGGAAVRNVMNQDFRHPFSVIIKHDPLAPFDIKEKLPVDKQVSINLLLMGCDVDYENGRNVEVKGSRGRSDSLMIARMDFTNNSINVLSIPRDTAVRIPGHKINKINAAHSIGGPELTAATVKAAFGIDSDYYISLNFDTFRKIVDKLHGVDLTVDKKLDYDDNWGDLHVHLKPGYQHLTGNQAMGYVRMRHSDDDLHRAARQHAFIEAIKSKVATADGFSSVPDILGMVFGDIHTNLDQDQLIAVMNWARQVPKENVQMATMPSFEGRSYVTVDIPKAERVVNHIFFNDEGSVKIDAPGMSMVENLVSHSTGGKRRKHGDKQKAGAGVDGSDENPFGDPSVSPGPAPGTRAVAPDGSTSNSKPGDATTPDGGNKGDDSSDTGTKSDGGTKTDGGPKANGDSKDGGKSGADGKDTGGKDGGTKDSGTKSGSDGKTTSPDKSGNN